MKNSRLHFAVSVGVALHRRVSGLLSNGPQPSQSSKQIPRTADGKADFNGFYNIPYVPNMAAGERPGGQGTTGAVDANLANG